MEAAAGVEYDNRGRVKYGHPTVITYADDFVALCHSREQAETVTARLDVWLKERGLSLNQEKTRIGRVDAGFDFLSFTIRRYYLRGGAKVLTTPSRTALKKTRQRLAQELRSLRGADPADVIRTLNPIIRGQANYYRPGASTKAFHTLDDYLWRRLDKWARRRHPNKPRRWVTARYFGAFHPTRRDRWVFGDRDSGAYLTKFSWTKIVRHVLVQAWASPDDPALEGYWAKRRHKRKIPPVDEHAARLLRAQGGRCPSCGEFLLHADHEPRSLLEWEQWLTTVRRVLRKQHIVEQADGHDRTFYRLLHAHCHRRQTAAQAATHSPEADAEPISPQRLA
jgi:RNA-directed DNA polymerase